jgi:hypothetical protein
MSIGVASCESSYFVALYLYASGPDSLVSCSEAGCPQYGAVIQRAHLRGGTTYYLVVDGFTIPGFPNCGQYRVRVDGCAAPCPASAVQESEPNEGCWGQDWNQVAAQDGGCATVCGRDSHAYDSDWYLATALGGPVEVRAASEFAICLRLYRADCTAPIVESPYHGFCGSESYVTSAYREGDPVLVMVEAPDDLLGARYTPRICGIQGPPPSPSLPVTWGRIMSRHRAE